MREDYLLTVYETYGLGLAELARLYLKINEKFTAFRPPVQGEKLLERVGRGPGSVCRTITAESHYVYPRLIIGVKPPPRRVVFEEVTPPRPSHDQLFIRHNNGGFASVYAEHANSALRLFRIVEDTERQA